MNNYGPVQVELLTRSVRISGFSRDADEVRRFSDVLNQPGPALVLEHVTFRDRDGAVLENADLAVVEKRDVVLVIPRESAQQDAQHRARRIGLAPAGQVPLPALLVMPPYMGKGTVNFHNQRDVYTGVSVLSPFFALIDATVLMDGRFYVKAPVVLVNREAVAAIASQERPPVQKPATAINPGALDRFVNPPPPQAQQPATLTPDGLTAEDLDRLRNIG